MIMIDNGTGTNISKKCFNWIKKKLLQQLGFASDGEFIFEQGKKVTDRYLEIPVKMSNMVILPGSTVILDDNELSISSYIEEFGDVFW